MPDEPTSKFKENAGVATAMIVVLSFVGIGYLKMAESILLSKVVETPDDWSAAMLSLASAALGYLIGRRSSSSGYSQDEYERALNAPPPAPGGHSPCPPLSPDPTPRRPPAASEDDEFGPPPATRR